MKKCSLPGCDIEISSQRVYCSRQHCLSHKKELIGRQVSLSIERRDQRREFFNKVVEDAKKGMPKLAIREKHNLSRDGLERILDGFSVTGIGALYKSRRNNDE